MLSLASKRSPYEPPAVFAGVKPPWEPGARPLGLALVQPSPSALPGVGHIESEGRTAFRVWAPFADDVAVVGDWNRARSGDLLAREGNGFWSADVSGPKIGDQYIFVIRHGENNLWKMNPYAHQVTHSGGGGRAIIHDPNFDWGDEHFTMPPWNELVIYELHIGSFTNAPGGGPGTFDGVIERLPYLRDQGFNAIEILPVTEFFMDVSLGYNPALLFAVETSLGGPQGLLRLVKEAHANGIAVILDVVYNHLGPQDNELWQFDGWTAPDHDGGVYFYDNVRADTHQWGSTRPDYGRPEVRDYIDENAVHWLEKYHIDGLRFDATAYIRNVFGNNDDAWNDLPDGWRLLQETNDSIDAAQPWKLTIAEDLRANAWITRGTGGGGAGFDSQWDSEFVHPVRAAIITPNDRDRDMAAVARSIQYRYDDSAFHRVIYTESHDEVRSGKQRVPSEIWNDNPSSWYSKKRSTLGAALVFTAPGIPMIFQGQEFLEDKWFEAERPLDWTKADTNAGIRRLYRDLVRLRRNWFDNTRGLRGQNVNVYHVNNDAKVIAFHRWEQGGAGDDVVVVLNFGNTGYSDYVVGFPRPGLWRVRFNSDWNGYDGSFFNWSSFDAWASDGGQDGLAYGGSVGLAPYTAVILSQDR